MTQRKGRARKRNNPSIAIIRPIAKPLLTPKCHLREDRHEALADLGKAVFELRKYLVVDLTMNETVDLKFAELLGEHGLRDAIDATHELAEALHLIGGYVPEKSIFRLPPSTACIRLMDSQRASACSSANLLSAIVLPDKSQ